MSTDADTDLAVLVAASACATSFDRLGADVVRGTGAFVLDTLGAGVAGSGAAGVAAGVELLREAGGTGQATLLVHGDRLPALGVAMLNGTMCQAWDFDPVYEPGVLLPYGPVVAAALAAAELAGATGPDFLTGVALGADLTCRLGRAVVTGLGWSRTATLGTFGAALASARILRLGPDATVSALGLALSQSAGTIQTVLDGSLAKRYQGGFAARSGLLAALLAARGVSGPEHVFEGPCGYFPLYESGRYRREAVLDGLGSQFEGMRASHKPFPCAREQHGAIDAALRLVESGVRAADVVEARVWLPPNAFALSGRPFGGSDRHTVADAIASAGYGVATAFVRGRVTLAEFQPGAVADPRVAEFARRVTVLKDAAVTDQRTLVPQTVEVLLADGTTRRAEVGDLPGSPERPLSDDELVAKVRSCGRFAAGPPDDTRVERLIETTMALQEVTDIADLLGAGSPERGDV